MVDHNEDEIDIIPRKLSFISSTAEDQLTAGAQVSILLSSHLSSSLPTAQPTDRDDSNPTIFSIRKIYKNLLIVSLALLLMSTAYTSIAVLQSSLNTEKNVGINSLIITYASTIFSAIFLAGIFMGIFGLKWSIILGEIAYVLYIITNIRPHPAFMYISAGLVGIATAPLWTAQAHYLNRIGRYHAHHKHQTVEVSVSLFFGIYSALQGTSLIWGNLISYFVLNQSDHPQKKNCGIYFDPQSSVSTNQTQNVNETTRYILCGIFAGMGILSVLLLFLMLDQIRLAKQQTIRQSMKKSVEVLTSLVQCKHIDQIFLIPLTMWSHIESSFLEAQFTRAFITCLAGIRHVGLVMVAHGICYATSSYIFGWLVKYIGRIGCFITAALLNYAMIGLMYYWQPNSDQMVVLYVIASVWATADAIWQSQVVATYTILYSESDPTAVAKYRLWKALGSVITYSYASYMTIRLSLILLLIFLTVSMIFYGIVEIRIRWKDRRKVPYSM